MYCKPVVDFFLGSLSPSGFTGWFAEAASEPGLTPYLIKAGPGCGKSTFMRRLADAESTRPAPRGRDIIERIHCSSDPDSLDGVLLPGAAALILDATAPHTLDCKYPGAAERVVSFYDTLDNESLSRQKQSVLSLGRRNTALLQQAAAVYALACGLFRQRRLLAGESLDTAKLDAFGRRFARRTMPPRICAVPGKQRHRLLSAPTPQGLTVFYDTIPQLANKIYALHDPYGAASEHLLALLAEHARSNGYDAILCHCATDQTKLDHLFVPELGLAFVTSNAWHPMRFPTQKNLHASRFMVSSRLKAERGTLNYQKRTADALLRRTCSMQRKAKTVHDELEKYYIAATDFAAVDAIRLRLQTEFDL